MNPDHLAAVWVEGDGDEYAMPKFATGYPIAPGLILTVAHIFKKNWSKVTVQIPGQANSATSIERADDDKPLVWCGQDRESEELDAALIAWKLPDSVGERIEFLNQRPASTVDWIAYGYPEFVRPEGTPGKPFDAGGTFRPQQDDPEFELVCNEKYSKPRAWRGASGGPIFKDGSNELAGIFRGIRHHGGEKAVDGDTIAPIQRIIGVPAWKLIDDDRFRKIRSGALETGLNAFQKSDDVWFSRLSARLADIFRRNQRAELLDEFNEVFGETAFTEASTLKTQLERLVRDRSVSRFLPADIVDLRDFCRERSFQDEAAAFDQMLTSVIPAMFTPEERLEIERLLNSEVAVRMDVSCPAGAAIKVAAYKRKPLDGDSISGWAGDIKRWTGRNGHSLEFILPGSVEVDQIAARIFHQLSTNELSADERSDVLRLRDEIAAGKVSEEAASNAVADCESQKGFVNSRLIQRERARGVSFCVYSSARLLGQEASERSRKRLNEAIAIVQGWLPAMRFMEISHSNPPEAEGFAVEQLAQLHEDWKGTGGT